MGSLALRRASEIVRTEIRRIREESCRVYGVRKFKATQAESAVQWLSNACSVVDPSTDARTWRGGGEPWPSQKRTARESPVRIQAL